MLIIRVLLYEAGRSHQLNEITILYSSYRAAPRLIYQDPAKRIWESILQGIAINPSYEKNQYDTK